MIPTPAQLWFGSPEQLQNHTQLHLQQFFCASNGCTTCTVCKHIASRQHHAITWLSPEKQYTLEQLEPIFHTISFELAHNEHHFFVIQKADMLTAACANSLLKSIEEPPAGYHFILLAERQDFILPTIRSRCMVKTFGATNSTSRSPLFAHFTTHTFADALQFMKDLDQSSINEIETIGLVDELLKYWIAQYSQSIATENSKQCAHAERIIAKLEGALLQPPMPGSSKLFWKNLFLQTMNNA